MYNALLLLKELPREYNKIATARIAPHHCTILEHIVCFLSGKLEFGFVRNLECLGGITLEFRAKLCLSQ